MRIELPDPSLVLLIGTSSSGKSTFAARHFASSEIVSSDECRRIVADDPEDQSATGAAFVVLHTIVDQRLGRNLLTVVDATNVEARARREVMHVAARRAIPVTAIVFDLPADVVNERNATRSDRRLPDRALEAQRSHLDRALRTLVEEGIDPVVVLRSVAEVDELAVARAELRRT